MDKDKKYTTILKEQIERHNDECRYLEFKSNYQTAEKLGRYISALSNGACLDHQSHAYLYFGVDDITHEVVGTKFDPPRVKAKGNQDLELYLRQYVSPKIPFVIDEFRYEGVERIVVFVIPAAAREPTCFMSQPYARINSQAVPMTPYTTMLRDIYLSDTDWTAQVVDDADIGMLDREAIAVAREGYKRNNSKFAADCDGWSDSVFLDRARLTADGHITKATLLLLGKAEAAHHLGHIAEIDLKCVIEGETAASVFMPPYLLTTSHLLQHIHNRTFKIYPVNSLIAHPVTKYDERSILEGLHNCILHQDYVRNERIIVTEKKDSLSFQNAGNFYCGTYEDYIEGEKVPPRYRNPFLAQAMRNTNMIDTQGYGIHHLYERQKERYLPMPDYADSTDEHVILHLPGNIIDENYSKLLMERKDITLTEAVLLDKVQKGEEITPKALALLRRRGFVEGRKTAIYISRDVAKAIGKEVEYSKHKGLLEPQCEMLLLNALRDHHSMQKSQIIQLLAPVLPDKLDERQKRNKVEYLIKKLKVERRIVNEHRGNVSTYSLPMD